MGDAVSEPRSSGGSETATHGNKTLDSSEITGDSVVAPLLFRGLKTAALVIINI